MFTVTFYKNYPYSHGGKATPCPLSVSARNTFLNNYFLYEKTEESCFFESQGVLEVDNLTNVDLSTANFIKIKYGTDGEERFYFVNNVATVQGLDEQDTLQFDLQEDLFLTHIYNGHTLPTLRHVKVNRAYDVQGVDQDGGLFGLNGEFGTTVPTFDKVGLFENKQKFIVLFTAINDDGGISVFQYYLQAASGNTYEFSATDTAGLDVLSQVARVAKVSQMQDVASPFNVNILKIYIMPWYFNSNNIFDTTTQEHLLNLDIQDAYARPISQSKVADGIKTMVSFTLPTNTNGSKLFLCTPKQKIPLPKYRSTQKSAQLLVAGSRNASDTLQFFVHVDGELYEITTDFEVDFAVNQARLNYNQNRLSENLKQLTSVIGTAGATYGAFRSGNIFGGVQAIGGGVESFLNYQQQFKQPATQKENGNAANFLGNGLIYFQKIVPSNTQQIIADYTAHGLVIDKFYNELSLPTNGVLQADVDNIVMTGTANLKGDQIIELKSRLAAGIKFEGV